MRLIHTFAASVGCGGWGGWVRARAACADQTEKQRHVVVMEAERESTAEALPVQYRRVNVPLFLGDGELDYACHGCGQVVCQGIAKGDLGGIVVRCACGAVNRVPRGASS